MVLPASRCRKPPPEPMARSRRCAPSWPKEDGSHGDRFNRRSQNFARQLSFERVDRLGDRPEPQGRLPQCDEMFERKAGDPPLPVTDGIKPPDRVRGRLGVELMIAARQV